jgi:hypothetical protein
VLDLKEEDKICKKTGKPLVKIGEEVTRRLAHTPEERLQIRQQNEIPIIDELTKKISERLSTEKLLLTFMG